MIHARTVKPHRCLISFSWVGYIYSFCVCACLYVCVPIGVSTAECADHPVTLLEVKMVEAWGMVGYQLPGSYQSSPPKVGFGVICRCPGRSELPHKHSQMQCLFILLCNAMVTYYTRM